MKRRDAQIDYPLLALVLTLLAFGLVMLGSASAIWAEQQTGDPLHFLKKQMLWAVLGLGAMSALSRLDYKRLGEWSWVAVAVSAIGLVAVLFSPPVAGVRRWIRLGPLGLQPAEFAKLAMVLFLADYLDRKRSKVGSLLQGAAIPWAVTGLLLGLISLEPDLGTPSLMFGVAVLMLFIGGARMRFVAGAVACAVPALAYELARLPYRRRRLLSFLEPWNDAQGTGYQLVQSLLAVGSGGLFGKGLGRSELKLMHLPTPHTDFIFPVVCEELGLIGALLLLGLFAALLARGLRIARGAPTLFGTLLAAGVTLLIGLQAVFNIAMSIGLLPTKGVPLPFFSFGGSSLLVTLMSCGILLSVSRQAE